jgi:hypothetical protein
VFTFCVPSGMSSGLKGRRRTYYTILKRAWSANFKMVSPPATSEAKSHTAGNTKSEQFEPARVRKLNEKKFRSFFLGKKAAFPAKLQF